MMLLVLKTFINKVQILVPSKKRSKQRKATKPKSRSKSKKKQRSRSRTKKRSKKKKLLFQTSLWKKRQALIQKYLPRNKNKLRMSDRFDDNLFHTSHEHYQPNYASHYGVQNYIETTNDDTDEAPIYDPFMNMNPMRPFTNTRFYPQDEIQSRPSIHSRNNSFTNFVKRELIGAEETAKRMNRISDGLDFVEQQQQYDSLNSEISSRVLQKSSNIDHTREKSGFRISKHSRIRSYDESNFKKKHITASPMRNRLMHRSSEGSESGVSRGQSTYNDLRELDRSLRMKNSMRHMKPSQYTTPETHLSPLALPQLK